MLKRWVIKNFGPMIEQLVRRIVRDEVVTYASVRQTLDIYEMRLEKLERETLKKIEKIEAALVQNEDR